MNSLNSKIIAYIEKSSSSIEVELCPIISKSQPYPEAQVRSYNISKNTEHWARVVYTHIYASRKHHNTTLPHAHLLYIHACAGPGGTWRGSPPRVCTHTYTYIRTYIYAWCIVWWGSRAHSQLPTMRARPDNARRKEAIREYVARGTPIGFVCAYMYGGENLLSLGRRGFCLSPILQASLCMLGKVFRV